MHARRAARRAGCCVAFALLAATALAAPSNAASIRYGVHGEGLTAPDVERMGEGDVGILRTPFLWRDVEPTRDGPRDWSRYDNLMTATSEAGVSVLPIILGTPGWVVHQGESWPEGEADLNEYRQWLKALVRRYGTNGSFWNEHPGLPETPIVVYQAWNEPNRPVFSPEGKVNARDYAAFLKITRKAIQKVDADAKIILAGMPERTTTSQPLAKFLEVFYKVDGIKDEFQAVCLHPYAADQAGVEGALTRLRALLEDFGDPKRSVWVTEIGWGTGGNHPAFSKTEAEQAQLLRRTFALLRDQRDRFRVRAVVWYSWRDSQPPFTSSQWQPYTGLFDFAGSPKPSWEDFTDFSGGDPGSGSIPAGGGGGGGGGIPLPVNGLPAKTQALPAPPE